MHFIQDLNNQGLYSAKQKACFSYFSVLYQLSSKITNVELKYFNHIADPNRQVSIFLTLFICSSKYLCFHMLLQVMSKVVGHATSPSCSGC